MTDLSRRIGARACLTTVPDEDFVDVFGPEAGLRNRSPSGNRAELRRVDVAKRSAVLADWCALRAQNDDVADGHKQPILVRWQRQAEARAARARHEVERPAVRRRD